MKFMFSWARQLIWIGFVGAFVLALGRPAFAGEDVLVIKNGDRMTGEVKKLAGGDLHFDADYGESLFVID